MKRYLVFIGKHYYPQTAMGDFVQDFNKEKEYLDFIDNYLQKQFKEDNWFDIKDFKEWIENDFGDSNFIIVYDCSQRKEVYDLFRYTELFLNQ